MLCLVFTSPTTQSNYESTHPISSLTTTLAPILSLDYVTFTSKRYSIALTSSSESIAAFEAPVTKIWTWWFPLTIADSSPFDTAHVPSAYPKFISANTTSPSGTLLASSGGWRREQDIIRETPAQSFSAFIGCEKLEDFRMAPPFGENIPGRIGLGMRTFRMGVHGVEEKESEAWDMSGTGCSH
jgi:hypothetical protein